MPDVDVSYEVKGEQARLDAIRDLCDLAHGDPDHYSAPLLLTRGAGVEVLIREALHTCHRPAMTGPLEVCGTCGRPAGGDPDLARADHILAVGRVALGKPLAVMDAVSGARPSPPPEPSTAGDVDALIARLEAT